MYRNATLLYSVTCLKRLETAHEWRRGSGGSSIRASAICRTNEFI